MNGAEKAFPMVETAHDVETGELRHWVSSKGGMTKREFAAFMCLCGYVATGRPFTPEDVLKSVDDLIEKL
jgi:hypothetical protein